jgi:hypothetical protein
VAVRGAASLEPEDPTVMQFQLLHALPHTALELNIHRQLPYCGVL